MGELSGGGAQKKTLDEKDKELTDLQQNGSIRGGDLQRKALEAQLKDKEEKLKLAEKRSKWIGAANMLFMAALATAALEILPESLLTLPLAMCDPASGVTISQPLGAAIVGGYTLITGGGITGGMLGAVAGYVLAGETMKTAMNSAMGRVASFGIVTALVMSAKGEVDKEIKTLKQDIADLKRVIAQFRLETDGDGRNDEDTTGGATAGVAGGVTSGASGGTSSGNLAGTTGGAGVTPLPAGQTATSPTRCINSSNQISTNCTNPLRLGTPNLSILGGQPELQQVASQGVEMANEAARGNIGKADIAAASLNSQASKISDIAKNELAKANRRLASQGKKLAGTEKEMKDILNSMQSAMNKENAKSGTNLAALGLGGFNDLDPAKADKSGLNITGASTDVIVKLPETKGDAAAVLPTDSSMDAASATAAAAAKKKAEESAKDALGKNLGDYESNDNDISANKETSLWKQVSNRYLLKYERFFERKKVPAQ